MKGRVCHLHPGRLFSSSDGLRVVVSWVKHLKPRMNQRGLEVPVPRMAH